MNPGTSGYSSRMGLHQPSVVVRIFVVQQSTRPIVIMQAFIQDPPKKDAFYAFKYRRRRGRLCVRVRMYKHLYMSIQIHTHMYKEET